MMRAAALSVLLLASCATAPAAGVPLGPQSPEGKWLLVSIAGERAEGEGYVEFDAPGGGFHGQAPCNGFGEMTYTLAGARILASGDGMITTAGCRNERRGKRERILVDEVLWNSPHFVIYGDRMMLTGPNGHVVELRKAPR